MTVEFRINPDAKSWPEKIKEGEKVGESVCLTDVLATVAHAIGETLTGGAGDDSYSFLPKLVGGDSETRPGVINHAVSGLFAIRRCSWKLVLGKGSGGRQQPKGKAFEKPYELYNHGNDPGEVRNFIEENPEIAKEMEAEFEKITGGDR